MDTRGAAGADSNRGGRDGNARGPRGPAVAVSSADNNNPWPARICAMKWPHVRHFAAAGSGPVTRDVTVRKVRIWPGFRPKSRVGAGFGPQNFGTALRTAKYAVFYVKMWTKCSSCWMTRSGFVFILVYPPPSGYTVYPLGVPYTRIDTKPDLVIQHDEHLVHILTCGPHVKTAYLACPRAVPKFWGPKPAPTREFGLNAGQILAFLSVTSRVTRPAPSRGKVSRVRPYHRANPRARGPYHHGERGYGRVALPGEQTQRQCERPDD